MKLDIKHWQMLKAMDDFGSLSRAAAQLNLSQSALSHRLAEAERRLGGPIFQRQGRRLILTPAGLSLTQVAQHVVPTLMRAEDRFVQTASDVEHLVKIGVAAYNSYHWLADFLQYLRFKHSHIQVEVVASTSTHTRQNLLQAEVDLVLVPGPFAGPGLDTHHLFYDQLVLVTSPTHALAQYAYIEAQHLLDEEVLTYGRDAYPGFEYDRFMRPAGVTPKVVKVIEMVGAIVELVSADQGVSILSRWAIEPSLKAGRLVAVPLGQQGLDLSWSGVCRQDELQHSPTRDVAKALQQWFCETSI